MGYVRNTRAGDGADEVVGVDLAEEGDKGPRVGTAVYDVRGCVRGKVVVLEARVLDVADKLHGVGEALLRGEEAEVLCG